MQYNSQLRKRTRCGVVYIVVLLATIIVAGMSLSAIETSRWHARELNQGADAILVRQAATTSLELALARINADENWRSTYTHNVDTRAVVFEAVSLKFRLIDEDGSLDDDAYDPVDIIATATMNEHQFSWRATLEPSGDALNCLLYSAASDQRIEVRSTHAMASDQSVATNDRIEVNSGAALTADCYYESSVSGDVFGAADTLDQSLNFPNHDALISHYRDLATSIDLTDLPTQGGDYVIDGQLLSSSSNTINSSLNSNGIYYIDCGHYDIRISNSRLKCTLVLENVGDNSYVQDSVHWEATQANSPILLVDGRMKFHLSRLPLYESAVGVNLNPNGTPFRGQVDNLIGTTYPSQLRGLIYVSEKIEFKGGENEIVGCLVGGHELKADATVILHYRSIFAENPPRGFQESQNMRIVSGSIYRVTTP